MKKYLVCYGTNNVELYAHGLSLENANVEADMACRSGKKNVRIREEDPIHSTWPLHFDAESTKVSK